MRGQIDCGRISGKSGPTVNPTRYDTHSQPHTGCRSGTATNQRNALHILPNPINSLFEIRLCARRLTRARPPFVGHDFPNGERGHSPGADRAAPPRETRPQEVCTHEASPVLDRGGARPICERALRARPRLEGYRACCANEDHRSDPKSRSKVLLTTRAPRAETRRGARGTGTPNPCTRSTATTCVLVLHTGTTTELLPATSTAATDVVHLCKPQLSTHFRSSILALPPSPLSGSCTATSHACPSSPSTATCTPARSCPSLLLSRAYAACTATAHVHATIASAGDGIGADFRRSSVATSDARVNSGETDGATTADSSVARIGYDGWRKWKY